MGIIFCLRIRDLCFIIVLKPWGSEVTLNRVLQKPYTVCKPGIMISIFGQIEKAFQVAEQAPHFGWHDLVAHLRAKVVRTWISPASRRILDADRGPRRSP